MTISTAMILAAGRGERLRPLTNHTPKPLLQVGKHKLIEYHLLALAAARVTRVVVNLSYLGHEIENYLGNGDTYGVEIVYSREPEGALETAGGIRHALPMLKDEQFLVVNGDIFCDVKFELLQLSDDASMHLVMVDNPQHHPLGDFALDQHTSPARLQIKAPDATGYTFSGIGVYRADIFAGLPRGRLALAPVICQQITRSAVTAQLHSGQWFDVGTVDRLHQVRNLAG